MQSDPTLTTLMPLSEAADALSQLAYDFHNVMLRQGTKELPPEEWMEEFRSWLPHGREFARQHAETIRWLEECERRHDDKPPPQTTAEQKLADDDMNPTNRLAPKRIQRQRTKGWRMPPGAIYVGRTTAGPSYDYGNRYVVGETVEHVDGRALFVADAKIATDAYREWLLWQIKKGYAPDLAALRGRDLACWCGLCALHRDGLPLGTNCPDCDLCHGDILLELSNEDGTDAGPLDPSAFNRSRSIRAAEAREPREGLHLSAD